MAEMDNMLRRAALFFACVLVATQDPYTDFYAGVFSSLFLKRLHTADEMDRVRVPDHIAQYRLAITKAGVRAFWNLEAVEKNMSITGDWIEVNVDMRVPLLAFESRSYYVIERNPTRWLTSSVFPLALFAARVRYSFQVAFNWKASTVEARHCTLTGIGDIESDPVPRTLRKYEENITSIAETVFTLVLQNDVAAACKKVLSGKEMLEFMKKELDEMNLPDLPWTQ